MAGRRALNLRSLAVSAFDAVSGGTEIVSSQSTTLCLHSSKGGEPFKAFCTDKPISLRALECNRSQQGQGILGCSLRQQQNS